MLEFLAKLFKSDFMPHGSCYFWRPEIVWLHVSSDALIALSYYGIPFILCYLVWRRKDLAFNWMFGCFAAFIFLCGTTHLLAIWTLWHPIYRFEGVVKAATAIVSVATAALLIPLVPKALRIPTSAQLEAANLALAEQIIVRERAQEEIRILNADLEQRVKERTAALQRSNEDLAQFAYVASHDLQEPLRMVSAYTQLLKMRYAGRLDPDADQYIGFAVQGSQRMQALIEDLLAFSRLDHGPESIPTQIPLRGALERALEALQISIQESAAQISFENLPVVSGDIVQLSQVFQNLISNSIKYRSERPPVIEIGAKPAEDAWIVWVKDNGIGFDQAYAERVFGVFKRLHGTDYPGTGIGLSITRKIVQRHGGKIWCEAKKGHGATFYFTLPMTRREAPASPEPAPRTARRR